jgi:hypothetical protein
LGIVTSCAVERDWNCLPPGRAHFEHRAEPRKEELTALGQEHSVKNVFQKEDAWVRGRLRAILKKRHKGKGRARGLDHQRWPNAYFADLGPFSLAIARAQAIQTRKRTH